MEKKSPHLRLILMVIAFLALTSQASAFAAQPYGVAGDPTRRLRQIDWCECDFEPDGDVDGSDLAFFLIDFGRTGCSGNCKGDVDRDGDVDSRDLTGFINDFGNTNCPVLDNLPAPQLISPTKSEELDNGCYDYSELKVWNFNWATVSNATKYQIYVKSPNASIPVIEEIVTATTYYFSDYAYIADKNSFNWSWKVRSGNDEGQWSEWSEIRYFNVEPVDTDCSNIDVLIVTTTLLDKDPNFNTIVNEYQNVLQDTENLGVKYVEVDSEECFLVMASKCLIPVTGMK